MPQIRLATYIVRNLFDDYSRKILAWTLSETMRIEDVTETLDLARAAAGATGRQRWSRAPHSISDDEACGHLGNRASIPSGFSK